MPTCPKCQSQFEITQDDLLFYDKISPVFNGRKYQIPEPKLCPDCKEQRRLALRNESKFYKRECGICGKIIISVYSPKSDYTVYCHECWWSDNFDPVEYGCDFDFSKSFSEQFQELFKNVPAVNLNTHSSNENSDYVNYISKSKNCYMCVAGGFLEDVYYSNLGINCKQSMDIYFSFDSELCYEIMNCSNCYDVKYSKDSKGCNNSWFVDDCIGCSNCILCSGLKNKSYCFKNKQLSKEEFFTIEKDFISNLPTEINHYREEFKWICLSVPKKYIHILNSESCSGDYIANSKGCVNCFEIRDAEDCINCMNVMGVKDVRSCSQCGLNTEVAYELMTGSLNIYHILFSSVIRDNSSDILYSFNISSCSNCFACIGLRRKQYCILNKQYSKQEYEELVPRIIEHMQKSTPLSPPYSRGEASEASRGVEWPEWGEFFNPRLSPFGYNETVAQEYFPLTKKQAQEQGFNWSDYEAPFPKVEKIIKADEIGTDQKFLIPENNDILNYVIECEITKKPFRIIKQELDFYRKHNLPLPKRHPDQRHKDRLSLRNPRKLWHRTCNKCNISIQTSYSPDRSETVYCEKCYLETVY